MSVKLYLGASGSGKSYAIYSDVIEESMRWTDKNYFVIVPEQFTMETQRDIVDMHPNNGTTNIDIVSFNRLAYRIFEELNLTTMELLDDVGKTMIVRQILSSIKDSLFVFGKCYNKVGFVDEIKSIISELYQYDVDVEELKKSMEELDEESVLRLKLHDICILYDAFKAYIDKRYAVSEDTMDLLCRCVSDSELIKDSVFCFDGFTGFTPIQYNLIEKLMGCKVDIRITLTLPYKDYIAHTNNEYDLFNLSIKTMDSIYSIALDTSNEILDPYICDKENIYRFIGKEDLNCLESNIFRTNKKSYEKESKRIKIVSCDNRRIEARYVGREISRLVAQENIRYKDVAIVCGNLEEIAHIYEETMPYYNIPYFIDSNISIRNNPCIEAIKAILAIVINDFSYESIFRYLKTGVSELDNDDIELMENFVIKYGFRGYKAYMVDWFDEDINIIKQGFMEEIAPVIFDWNKKYTAREYIEVLFGFLRSIKLEEKIYSKAQEYEHIGDNGRYRIYSKIYLEIIGLFDRIVDVMSDEIMSFDVFAEIMETGLDSIDVGIIPPSSDQVIIGDIERTRINHIKVLFFVEVNEGIIPKANNDTGVFNDRDKNTLKTIGVELAPTNRENTFHENMYIYMNITKPSEYLYMSYIKVDQQGVSQKKSNIFNQFDVIFPFNVETYVDEHISDVWSYQDGIDLLCDVLLKYDEEETIEADYEEKCRYVYEILNEEKYVNRIKALKDGLFYTYKTDGISSDIAHKLYGEVIKGSVSRLEGYSSCPYSFFLKYGLELGEREEYQIKATDIGSILHKTLEKTFSYVLDNSELEWTNLDDNNRDRLVERFLEEAVSEENSTIFNSSARKRYIYKKMENISKRSMKTLQKHIIQGKMKPVMFEEKYGETSKLKSTQYILDNDVTMQLNGVVDRVDVYESGENVYYRIIDYKSGARKFSLTEFYNGLNMQLVSYMDVVQEMLEKKYTGKKVIPAGIFYYHMSNPMVEALNEDVAEMAIVKKQRLAGLIYDDNESIENMDRDISVSLNLNVNKDKTIRDKRCLVDSEKIDLLEKHLRSTIETIGKDISAGCIDVTPVSHNQITSCRYCPYVSVCRLDKNNSYSYKYIKDISDEDIWKELKDKYEMD